MKNWLMWAFFHTKIQKKKLKKTMGIRRERFLPKNGDGLKSKVESFKSGGKNRNLVMTAFNLVFLKLLFGSIWGRIYFVFSTS